MMTRQRSAVGIDELMTNIRPEVSAFSASLAPPDNTMGARLAAGDASALQEIYERTVSRCYGLAMAILGDADGADKTVESAYVTFWSNRVNAKLTRDPLTTLLGHTRHAALALLTDPADDEPRASPDLLARLDPGTAVFRIVAALPVEERRILARAFLQRMDIAAIARAERLPVTAVRATLAELSSMIRTTRQ